MRNNIKNQARVIVSEAVKAARNDQSRSPVPLSGAAQAQRGTTKGTDGSGNIFTIHAMIWDLDNWDDPGSVWA